MFFTPILHRGSIVSSCALTTKLQNLTWEQKLAEHRALTVLGQGLVSKAAGGSHVYLDPMAAWDKRPKIEVNIYPTRHEMDAADTATVARLT